MQTTPISVIKYDNDKEDKNKFNALLERFGDKIGATPVVKQNDSPPPYTREEFKQNTECNCEQCQMKRASFNKQPPPDKEKSESKTEQDQSKEQWQYNFSQLDNGAVSITSPSIAGIDIQWVILAIVICILLFQIMSWFMMCQFLTILLYFLQYLFFLFLYVLFLHILQLKKL